MWTRSCEHPAGPFVEALGQLARVIDPDELRVALGTGGGELTRLLPDLSARVGDLPSPGGDADAERHRLHTAVADLLADVDGDCRCYSSSRTVTGPTGRHCCCCAISLAAPRRPASACSATFRDTDADVPAALAETLADLPEIR